MERLELLRANLNPKRRSAPLYANDPAAYAAMQEAQLEAFPVDVGMSRLYVWECDSDDCGADEADSGDADVTWETEAI